jgi:hypothetical protein
MVGLRAMVLGRLGQTENSPIQEHVLYPAPRSPFTGRGLVERINPGPRLAATVLGRAFLTPLLALPLELRH